MYAHVGEDAQPQIWKGCLEHPGLNMQVMGRLTVRTALRTDDSLFTPYTTRTCKALESAVP